jgi:hypothetical protein
MKRRDLPKIFNFYPRNFLFFRPIFFLGSWGIKNPSAENSEIKNQTAEENKNYEIVIEAYGRGLSPRLPFSAPHFGFEFSNPKKESLYFIYPGMNYGALARPDA